jgi:hypothetical protein
VQVPRGERKSDFEGALCFVLVCDLYLFVQLIYIYIHLHISGLSDQWRWPLLHIFALSLYIFLLLGQWENTD